MYVQYGCGLSAPDGWENFDASPTLMFERLPAIGRLYTRNAGRFPDRVRYGDVARGLPVSTGSCNGIFCSHVLEHLALADCELALANTYSYLKAGGTFRLVVPDLRQLVVRYLEDSSDDAGHSFILATCLGRSARPRGWIGALRAWLGNSEHLWMWDEKSMAAALRRHGFVDVRRCAFGDSPDPKFREVEAEDRFTDCLAMEGRK
jgi:hypothetical protein